MYIVVIPRKEKCNLSLFYDWILLFYLFGENQAAVATSHDIIVLICSVLLTVSTGCNLSCRCPDTPAKITRMGIWWFNGIWMGHNGTNDDDNVQLHTIFWFVAISVCVGRHHLNCHEKCWVYVAARIPCKQSGMGGKVSNFNRSCEMIEGCLDIKKILGRNKTSTQRYPKCQFVEGNHKNHKGRRQTCNQSSQPCGISTSVTGFPNHGELPAGRNREEPPLIQLTSLCEQTVSNYHD